MSATGSTDEESIIRHTGNDLPKSSLSHGAPDSLRYLRKVGRGRGGVFALRRSAGPEREHRSDAVAQQWPCRDRASIAAPWIRTLRPGRISSPGTLPGYALPKTRRRPTSGSFAPAPNRSCRLRSQNRLCTIPGFARTGSTCGKLHIPSAGDAYTCLHAATASSTRGRPKKRESAPSTAPFPLIGMPGGAPPGHSGPADDTRGRPNPIPCGSARSYILHVQKYIFFRCTRNAARSPHRSGGYGHPTDHSSTRLCRNPCTDRVQRIRHRDRAHTPPSREGQRTAMRIAVGVRSAPVAGPERERPSGFERPEPERPGV